MSLVHPVASINDGLASQSAILLYRGNFLDRNVDCILLQLCKICRGLAGPNAYLISVCRPVEQGNSSCCFRSNETYARFGAARARC